MWSLLVAMAWGSECTYVSFRDVVEPSPPAILVLGERHGTQPDMRRAVRVVRRLARTAEVTVALEAVHHRYQPILDRYAASQVPSGDLPALLDWKRSWGFRWRPYAPLVTAADLPGTAVLGVGLDLGPKPEDVEIPIPSRYADVLRVAMGDHPMPPSREASFVQAMAWRDHEIARRAWEGWDGQGYLVVVTGRGHIEGGRGVDWQLSQMTDVAVHAVVLKPGGEPACYPGDQLWR